MNSIPYVDQDALAQQTGWVRNESDFSIEKLQPAVVIITDEDMIAVSYPTQQTEVA